MKWTKETIQKELQEMDAYLPVYKIEERLGMPPTTLQKVMSGKRSLPKKWEKKLEAYFVRKPEKVAVIEYNPPAIFSSKENIDKLNAAFMEEGFRPKTLDQLKAMCPPELTGFDRSEWISVNRQKYSI